MRNSTQGEEWASWWFSQQPQQCGQCNAATSGDLQLLRSCSKVSNSSAPLHVTELLLLCPPFPKQDVMKGRTKNRIRKDSSTDFHGYMITPKCLNIQHGIPCVI